MHRDPALQPAPQAVAAIPVPGLSRIANTSRRCMIDNCNNLQLRQMPNRIKVCLMSYYDLLIPPLAPISQNHLTNISLELIEIQHDSNLKDTFESVINLEDFWSQKAISWSKLRDIAIRYLTLFSSTYLCEQGFSALLIIKNKHRNRLDATACV